MIGFSSKWAIPWLEADRCWGGNYSQDNSKRISAAAPKMVMYLLLDVFALHCRNQHSVKGAGWEGSWELIRLGGQGSLVSLASTLRSLFWWGSLIMGWALLTSHIYCHVGTGMGHEGTLPRDRCFQPWDNFPFTSEPVFYWDVSWESGFAVHQWRCEVHTKLSLHSENNNS